MISSGNHLEWVQMFRSPVLFALAMITAILVSAAPNDDDAGPKPPCGTSDVFPAFPAVDSPPALKVWNHNDFDGEWMPPACTGWTESGFSTLVAAAARFR